MRAAQDQPRRNPRGTRRTRAALVVGALVLIALIASLRGLANFWTDYLWFQSVGFTSVFRGVLVTKILLAAVFTVIFFLLMLANLTVVDRLSPSEVDPGAVNDLVVRYREFAYNRGVKIRLIVSLIFGVIGGVGANSEWNNWDLFRYHISFKVTDPQFHKDVGFYVFQLPFIKFLIGWTFEAVVVALIVSAVFHYLNGGIVPQATGQRVSAAVKAHLSVLLGMLAIIKAVAYYFDRLALTLSRAHVVNGATATSVHADAPAKLLLMVIAVISALLFLANIRQRGWILPAVAVVLWGLVSLLVGTAYPALYQALRVNPSELTREAPYIQRNIDATRAAYGLNKVTVDSSYRYSPTLTPSQVQGNSPQAAVNQQTIANVRLLDPAVNILNTFDKYQALRSYYSFNELDLDRYQLPGANGTLQETATVASVRELNSSIPSGFVNQHLQYTHGYGAVLAPISQAGVDSNGNPNFTLSGLPPSGPSQVQLSTAGASIYYDNGPDTNSYVIANSKTPELDYENTSTGQQVTNHYSGSGGVPAGNLLRRAAFALRFGDANFVLSGQITSSSRVMYIRNVTARVQKAAPFLKFDSDPYAVILNGQTYWVVDAYTTSDNYPYSQNANLDGLPANSGLNTTFNYVRNSVKVVVNAYNGKMTFFDMGTGDPILKVYERAFPDLFTPVSQADKLYPGITAHFRYPENIFQVQTNMYGRYHLTNATDFYSQAQAWAVSPDPGSGPLTSTSPLGATVIGANGQVITPQIPRLQPQYILANLPDSKQPAVNFLLLTPFVPISSTGSRQNLTAFMTASSDPGTYGQLKVFQLPPGETVDGPGLISNAIRSNPQISAELTFYNQQSSQVELGEVDIVPIDHTLLYVEPVYVESSTNHIPELRDVVVVYNGQAYHSSNASLDGALCQIGAPFTAYCNTAAANAGPLINPNLGTGGTGSSSTGGSTSTTTTPTTIPSTATTVPAPAGNATVQSLLAQAASDLQAAESALKAGDLGTYQAKNQAAYTAVQQAQKLQASTSSTAPTSPPTTPPTTATPSTTAPPGGT